VCKTGHFYFAKNRTFSLCLDSETRILFSCYLDKESDIDLAIISPDFSGNRYLDSLKIIPFRRKIDNRIEPVPFKSGDFDDADPLGCRDKRNRP